MRRLLLAGLFVFSLFSSGTAQEPAVQTPPAAPVLTDTAKLAVQAAFANFQLADVRLQLARSELLRVLAPLERQGYDLDVQTLSYRERPKPEEPK